MDNSYLKDLIAEAKKRDGGLILSLEGQPEVVVLTVEKYNQFLQGLAQSSSSSSDNASQALGLRGQGQTRHEEGKSILVTGGAGYIGAHIAKKLLSLGWQVIVLDNLSTGKKENIPAGAKFIEGDVKDLNLLRDIFAQERISTVMHLAAYIEVDESIKQPLKYLENNALATARLLKAMHEAGVKDLIFSSTCAVYAPAADGLISEEGALEPKSPYGFSKLLAENIIKYYCEYLGFRAVVFRYFNACGCDFDGGIKATHESHLIAKIIQVAKGHENVLTVHGADYATADGTCVRDYVHVLDIAQAHIKALEILKSARGLKIYNIGTGKGWSVLEVANSAAEILNKMVPMEIGPRRAGDLPMTVADNKKMTQELGFAPKYSDLETILKTAWKQASQD